MAVVGANVAGICAARGFARAGVPVALLGPVRAADHGLVHGGLAETPARLCDALGLRRFGEQTVFACRGPSLLPESVVSRADGVWLSVGPGEDALMAPSARALCQAGVPATVLEERELRALGLRGQRGLRVPGEALVDPDEAIAALLASAEGVRHVSALPTAIAYTGDGLELTLDDASGRLRAEIVVLTDGVNAARWVPWLAEVLVPVREQALVVEGALPALVGRAGHGHTWFRPWGSAPSSDSHAQVAVGGARWATPHLEVGETTPEIVPAVQQRLEAFARERLGLEGAVRHRWSWIDAHACDGLPVVGPLPGDPRVVLCAGFGGNEWGFGPPSAAAVVHGILSPGPDHTPAHFSPSRFVG